ncbi:hypothetical protein [Vibrio vulnificus]|uniref:hypothetical protein n=1 Tax=Vibrio vulnificus TaxID=672 RepID=UPI0005068B45|nr:hypothetical protein [Vibrio vulnificus]EJS4045566.1 hypothetical protein [Vibrio vulnificus]KFK53421.1 hypothetical protein JS86_19985 [Vibrio vulnificus]MCR9501680.1 hypothetical protein [Vibrio vulnificus]
MDLEEIKQGLSTEKLETYRQVLDCKSDSELIAVYMAMQSIMSQFFSVVQLLEVTLRNSIHKSATECFEDDEWYKRIPISHESKKQVDFAEQQCLDDVGARYTSNDLISRLPFGFWVHMLHRDYNNPRDKEHNLWQTQLDKCFPNAKAQNVKLNTLFQRMGSLNKFRNRLFHHEPAWKGRQTKNRSDAVQYLLKMFNEHMEAIGLLSTSKRELIAVLGFEERFLQECDIKSLERFESILSPDEK